MASKTLRLHPRTRAGAARGACDLGAASQPPPVDGHSAPGDATLTARPFRAVVFDWDGTAVADRLEDASEVAHLLRELLRRRVWIVVVTGTNFGNVDRQLCRLIPPTRRRRLITCTNRGSEVYGFDRRGNLLQRWLRVATPEEDQALTRTAESVRDAIVERTGLDIDIVYDRLNRRKIDLIPLAQWADPPKSAIGELLAAVEERLRTAGLPGGLGEVVALTERMAREHGLDDARITTDVKHVEVGLTDKGDSLEWVKHEILGNERIRWEDVLIAGDEFGPIAGFAGSDDRLRGGAEGAVVVSVGTEPNGAPGGVLHLGGGPPGFRQLLRQQLRLHPPVSPPRSQARVSDHDLEIWDLGPDEWRVDEHGYDPAIERQIESRLSIGNGYLGVRGSLELPAAPSRPRTFVAGLFDTPESDPAVPALVPGPDWLQLQISVNGHPVTLEGSESLGVHRSLDLRHGILRTDLRLRDSRGRAIRVRGLRFVSLTRRSLAVQVVEITVDQPATIELRTVQQSPSGELVADGATGAVTLWRTAHGGRRLAVAESARLAINGRRRPALATESRDGATSRWRWRASPNRPATLVRMVAMAHEGLSSDPSKAALASLRSARRLGLAQTMAEHSLAWADRWTASDLEVEGNDSAQRSLRVATYHLISAANPDDERVSIGARGLTGQAYAGHVFWDTEIFLLPLYILTWPAAARALLMYRFHTLPAARAKAAQYGYRGAFYAWESAERGEEATPPYVFGREHEAIMIPNARQEQHISADVAYAVWQYWRATADESFMLDAGAEIILETARFWASRAEAGSDGRWHIRRVIGPDEYHGGVDDNAYTNGMAQWNLERALEVIKLLQSRWPERWRALRDRLRITPGEEADWRRIASTLATGLDPATGLIEQFDGFFRLENIDISNGTPRHAAMDVVLGPERIQRSQISKQADVVMLLALLPERFPLAVQAANYAYYEPRCAHGSSLSPAVHALVAARLGQVRLAEQYFRQAAAIDLDDTMGNAADGVHMAALGGLWQAAVFGFAGVSPCPDGLRLTPHLPESWRSLRFSIVWRGRQVRVHARRAPRVLTATLGAGEPLVLHVGRAEHRLEPGDLWTCPWGVDETSPLS